MAKKLTSTKARKILHDKEVHGHPLTEQQRKFFGAIASGAKPYKAEEGGWLDKYDAPQAQNGIEGTMGGLTDIGFNYNGAWNGPSMQMGGSLPGSVGFMYARTQSPAPSNGPYAKKTKASAQNGSNVNLIPRATGDLRGPKIDPRFAENVTVAKEMDNYSTFEELRNTPGLKLYSDDELSRMSKQDPSKWSKHVKQEYSDRQSKKMLAQAHPDYNPEMSFEDQQGLVNDKSLRARVLRGRNLLTSSDYGPASLAMVNTILTAPANLVANTAFNAYNSYVKPGIAGGLTNALGDVMDILSPISPGALATSAAIKTLPKTAMKRAYEEGGKIKKAQGGELIERALRAASSAGGRGAAKAATQRATRAATTVGRQAAAREATERAARAATPVQGSLEEIQRTQQLIREIEARNSLRQPPASQTRVVRETTQPQTATAATSAPARPARQFYNVDRTVEQAFPENVQAYQQAKSRLQDIFTSSQARQAFRQIGELRTADRASALGDPAYAAAITDENLPIQIIDEIDKSLLSVNPADVALSRDQVKYLKNYGGLLTDVANVASNISSSSYLSDKDIIPFILENSKNLSTREIEPILNTLGLDPGDLRSTINTLRAERAVAPVSSPLARYTAGQDLLLLAEDYPEISRLLSQNPSTRLGSESYLAGKTRTALGEMLAASELIRPQVSINPDYFTAAGSVSDSQNIFGALFRRPQTRRIPTQQERAAAAEEISRQISSRKKDIFVEKKPEDFSLTDEYTDYINRRNREVKGKTFIGSYDMSSDSYDISQRAALLNDRLNFDLVPMYGGNFSDASSRFMARPSQANVLGGVTQTGVNRGIYTKKLQKQLNQKQLAQLSENQRSMIANTREPIDAKTLNSLMIETRFANATNAELNRVLGTNLPTSVVDPFRLSYGAVNATKPNRPLLGFIPKRDGGDIPVDPMGYWNADNVGNPVIIPSNVITMEGVDQPLLGISDTGDVQYMMPGEDYEFDGEYVTEYPVAKKGISVNKADAQPLKKLDQLLNFTNYNKPTKGGWLDKYN